jgi:hypothetical protein
MARFGRALAVLVLVVGIVLSPLRAVAAALPMLFAYGAAVPPTATIPVGRSAAVRSEAKPRGINDYDRLLLAYSGPSKPHVAAGAAGAIRTYDGALKSRQSG